MMTRLRGRAGMTLMELVVAVGLCALVMVAVSAFSTMLSRTSTQITGEFSPIEQGNLAIEAVYQRLLRAPAMGVSADGTQEIMFQITNNGTGVDFMDLDGTDVDHVTTVGNKIIFTTPNDQQTLLTGAQSVSFYPVPYNSLAIQIVLANNQGTLVSSVYPRNKNTPGSWIN